MTKHNPANSRGWSRTSSSGITVEHTTPHKVKEPIEVVVKQEPVIIEPTYEPVAIKEEPLDTSGLSKHNIKALIIEALKASVFQRGVTYKKIGERFNVSPNLVFKYRKEL